MANIKFTDRDSCDALIADVRSDTTETNWALFSYAGSTNNTIEEVAKGEGGIEEIHGHLKDDMIGYALLRVVDLVDGHKTIKFVKVTFVGPNVRIMLRARMGTQKVKINQFLGQFHCDIHGTSVEELSQDELQAKINRATGGGTRVFADGRQRGSASAVTPKEGSAAASTAPRRAYVGSFGDEQRRRAQQQASNVTRSKFAGASPSRGYVGSYGDEQRRKAQAAMSSRGRDKFSGSAASYSGGGLSFVDAANVKSQKLASAANRFGTDAIIKSEQKQYKGTYVGTYGDEQRKAAQANASNPHKTLLTTDKPAAGGGLSFVDAANMKSQKLASAANRSGTDAIIMSEQKQHKGTYVGSYGDDQRKAAQANASNLHKTVLSSDASAASAHLGVADAQAVKTQRQTQEMTKTSANQIVRSDEVSVGSAELGMAEAHAVKAQKQTSEMTKTSANQIVRSEDAPAASAHLGVADAQAVKTQRQTEEMLSSGQDLILKYSEKGGGEVPASAD